MGARARVANMLPRRACRQLISLATLFDFWICRSAAIAVVVVVAELFGKNGNAPHTARRTALSDASKLHTHMLHMLQRNAATTTQQK